MLKMLRKPTVAAWLANQLVRAEPDRVDELTGLGSELRAAHLAGDGALLRELTPRRHNLVRDLVRAARALADHAGRLVTQPVAERLTETLDAALVDPGAARMLRGGRLTSALRHVGFGVVDEAGQPARMPSTKTKKIAAIRPKPAPRPRKKPTETGASREDVRLRRRQELEALVAEADAEYAKAEGVRAAAESELDAIEHHVSDMGTAIDRLNEELDRARDELRQAQSKIPVLERRLRIATRAAGKAARQLDLRRQRLDGFGT